MEKKKRPQKISEEFKLSVIRDYYSSGMSKNACRVKYGLTSPTMLNSWLKKYSDVLNPNRSLEKYAFFLSYFCYFYSKNQALNNITSYRNKHSLTIC